MFRNIKEVRNSSSTKRRHNENYPTYVIGTIYAPLPDISNPYFAQDLQNDIVYTNFFVYLYTRISDTCLHLRESFTVSYRIHGSGLSVIMY